MSFVISNMRNDLIERIQIFLKTYASISPNWDGSNEDDSYEDEDDSYEEEDN